MYTRNDMINAFITGCMNCAGRLDSEDYDFNGLAEEFLQEEYPEKPEKETERKPDNQDKCFPLSMPKNWGCDEL